MIKLNLVKFGSWGAMISATMFAAIFSLFVVFGKNMGESAMVWMFYGGIALILLKIVFVFSIISLLIGLFSDRRNTTEHGN